MMNLVLLDADTLGEVPNMHVLHEFGNLVGYGTTSPSERIERVKEAEIIITNKVLIDKAVLDAAPRLRLVCIAATGTNNVDIEYAAQKGIAVKNVAGYSTESVAQLTFAAILQLISQLTYYDSYVKSGDYTRSPIFTHIAPQKTWQLSGKQFGIIGLGAIGKRVAQIAEAFGAKVLYHSTSGKNRHPSYPQLPLNDLLQSSDILSIHAPLNEATQNLIGYKELQSMKPHAILVNVGRGGIVVEKELAQAIEEGEIGGAAIDVFEHEPMLAGHPLLQIADQSRLVLTPHIAWASVEARTLLIEKVAENIKLFLGK